MRIKNHETPRKMGVRNKKGKIAAAKLRQIKKKEKMLIKKLKS